MKRLFMVSLTVLMALMLAVSCAEPKANAHTITAYVSASDMTAAKTIGFDGSTTADKATAITHYVIWAFEGSSVGDTENAQDSDHANGYIGKSDYLPAGQAKYQITNLTTQQYTFYAEGYIQNSDTTSYTLIASGKTTSNISPSNNTFNIDVNTFPTGVQSGDITVDVTLPVDLIGTNGTTFNGKLSWKITSMSDYSTPVAEATIDTLTADEGHYELSIDVSSYTAVTPGVWMLFLTATDSADEENTYMSADVLRLLPSLPATGAIDLNSLKPDAYDFTITDKIGTELKFSSDKEAYEAVDDGVTVTLTNATGVSNIIWFVDGTQVSPTAGEGAAGEYTFDNLAPGVRCITGVLYNADKEAEAGSVAFRVTVPDDIEITVKP